MSKLRFPRAAPACFASQAQWEEYKALAKSTGEQDHTFCTDCLPGFKDRMIEERHCAFPGTTFTAPHGAIIGKRAR